MYEFMKMEDEQHTALTLCLLFLSRLIACSLAAAPCPSSALARQGCPAHPAAMGKGLG